MAILNQSMLKLAQQMGNRRGASDYYLHDGGKGVFVQFPNSQAGVVVTPSATIPVESKPAGYTKFSIYLHIHTA